MEIQIFWLHRPQIQVRDDPYYRPIRVRFVIKTMPETPIEKLKKMTAWDSDPALILTELEEILAQSSRPDALGLEPQHENWTPTYSLNAAAESAWLVKAGRASSLNEVDPPGSGIVTSKVFDNCRSMARVYAAKKLTSVATR
ncbi:MAG: hypothetical protein H7070_04415 [Saprospiraceae bacterium]|nr:hypothetical protein [Pyrinomonadaceae bacterium]